MLKNLSLVYRVLYGSFIQIVINALAFKNNGYQLQSFDY